MTTPPATRDRIVAAYEDLLINDGPRAATLDAVAALAGVSKGGLLYHFKSKEALTAGLLEKLRSLAALDFALMASDPQGSAHYYVRTSVFGGTTFDRTIVAAMRLAQGEEPAVREAFAGIHARWYQLILADIGDAAVAHAVMLIGDGLYYNAALFGLSSPVPAADGASGGAEVAALLAVVSGMRATATQ